MLHPEARIPSVHRGRALAEKNHTRNRPRVSISADDSKIDKYAFLQLGMNGSRDYPLTRPKEKILVAIDHEG